MISKVLYNTFHSYLLITTQMSKKISLRPGLLLLVLILLFSFSHCTKDIEPALPVLTTLVASNITSGEADCGGTISSDGGSTIVSRGVCWSKNAVPSVSDNKTTDGSGTGAFTSKINGLEPNTIYHVRAYANNSAGISYGNEISFTTLSDIPEVTTTIISAVTNSGATGGGNVTNDGGAPVSNRGICWSQSHNPSVSDSHTSDGSGTGAFISDMAGLSSNNYYYVRAYATNNAGTGYGSEVVFSTSGTVTDYDGNDYKTINIGTQIWMAENLRTTKYMNGDPIPNVTDGNEWWIGTSVLDAYCWYNNDAASFKNTYGALYNWMAVSDIRSLMPAGWHLPTEADWNTLVNFLGGSGSAGRKLKESGSSHWIQNDASTTNSSGFTALPGGSMGDWAANMGSFGYWWSSTVVNSENANHFRLDNSSITRIDPGGKRYGLSVRYVKDN